MSRADEPAVEPRPCQPPTTTPKGGPAVAMGLATLLVESFSILFNHRSFQKPDAFSQGFSRFSRKKDPWKEWGRYTLNYWLVLSRGCFVFRIIPSSPAEHKQDDPPTFFTWNRSTFGTNSSFQKRKWFNPGPPKIRFHVHWWEGIRSLIPEPAPKKADMSYHIALRPAKRNKKT